MRWNGEYETFEDYAKAKMWVEEGTDDHRRMAAHWAEGHNLLLFDETAAAVLEDSPVSPWRCWATKGACKAIDDAGLELADPFLRLGQGDYGLLCKKDVALSRDMAGKVGAFQMGAYRVGRATLYLINYVGTEATLMLNDEY
jgi:hypothetical protein